MLLKNIEKNGTLHEIGKPEALTRNLNGLFQDV